jgi:dTDP-4-amino-4,6-dideoxygalactose transaminase
MMTTFHCGEMGRGPSQLAADWLSGQGTVHLPVAAGSQTVFTQSGRAAILLAARLWGLGDGDDVLVPAYNCGADISPLIATGANVSMYRVDERARIDLKDLMNRITPRVRLVVVTHYFGRPAEIGELVRFCRERQIKVLEDCALSLFSDAIGHHGDAAIFSFRKSLPAVDGGALVLRQANADANDLTNPTSGGATARGALSLIKRWTQTLLPLRPSDASERREESAEEYAPSVPDIPISYYCHQDASVSGASRFTLGLLNRINPHEIVRRRRDNYAHLRRCLAGIEGIEFLWDEEELPNGVCPLGLPILVNERWRWHAELNAAGVAVTRWWEGYHRGLDWEHFPEARHLKEHLLLLPVHQGLTPRHMEYAAGVVRSLSNRRRARPN